MHTFVNWLIANAIGLGTGFVFGWLCFKRPDLMERFFAWLKAKIFGPKV